MLTDPREGLTVFTGDTGLWLIVLAFGLLKRDRRGRGFTLGPSIAKETIGERGWGFVPSAEAVGIHVEDFQVMSINGDPQPFSYQDTVNLPPRSSVVIRIPFLDFTGKFVYHCHILAHEDFGMMSVIEVVE